MSIGVVVNGQFNMRRGGVVTPEAHPRFFWFVVGFWFIVGIVVAGLGIDKFRCYLTSRRARRRMEQGKEP